MTLPNQRLLTATEKVWRVARDKYLVFVAATMHLISKYTVDICIAQGAWHPPNTLSTMVHRYAFRIITWQPLIEDTHNPSHRGGTEQLWWYESKELSPASSVLNSTYINDLYIYLYTTSEKTVNDQSYGVLDRYGNTILYK